MLNCYPWGLSLNRVVPEAINRTRIEFRSYVWDEAKLGQGAGGALHQVEMEDEAIVARLVPINLTPHKQSQSWRFLFSKEITTLAPDCNVKNLSILLSLEGYWEIWYTDVLKKSLSVPLHEQR